LPRNLEQHGVVRHGQVGHARKITLSSNC
jgi:hypothetical protein